MSCADRVNIFREITSSLVCNSRAVLTVGDVHCEISQVRFTPQEVTDALLFMKPYNLNLTCEKSQSSLDVLISLIADIRAYIYVCLSFSFTLYNFFRICDNFEL